VTDATAARTDPPLHGAELPMLLGFLDYHRATLLMKVEGLDKEQMNRRLPSSGSELTLAGLVKHLALVEDTWFSERTVGTPVEPWASAPWDDDVDWDFHSAPDDEPADLVALYRAACERSRRVVDSVGGDLDHRTVVPSRSGEHFALRWVILHMIEETARHNGHADLLRESIDGVTGE
jgi:hypothetical protein